MFGDTNILLTLLHELMRMKLDGTIQCVHDFASLLLKFSYHEYFFFVLINREHFQQVITYFDEAERRK